MKLKLISTTASRVHMGVSFYLTVVLYRILHVNYSSGLTITFTKRFIFFLNKQKLQ